MTFRRNSLKNDLNIFLAPSDDIGYFVIGLMLVEANCFPYKEQGYIASWFMHQIKRYAICNMNIDILIFWLTIPIL